MHTQHTHTHILTPTHIDYTAHSGLDEETASWAKFFTLSLMTYTCTESHTHTYIHTSTFTCIPLSSEALSSRILFLNNSGLIQDHAYLYPHTHHTAACDLTQTAPWQRPIWLTFFPYLAVHKKEDWGPVKEGEVSLIPSSRGG